MRRAQLNGGSLLGRTARPAVAAAVPWVCYQQQLTTGSRLSCSATNAVSKGQTQPQPLSLERVLSELRRTQGIEKLVPGLEAVVHGRGKHMGTAVQWSLRWTASGCFMEDIRGPQLTFKWGFDGLRESGCWEVDSSGLVRVMECDDHEAVLLTTYIRTGCWLQPHLQDRFDLELLPTAIRGAGSSSSIAVSTSSRSGTGGVGSSAASGSSGNGDAGGGTHRNRNPGRTGTDTSGGGGDAGRDDVVGVEESTAGSSAEPRFTTISSTFATDEGGGTGGAEGSGTSSGVVHGPPRVEDRKGEARTADDVVAIGIRVRGKKLRVRAMVRQRDWRLLGFDHRMCADTETWELGEWREWADGVRYPASALHRAANGGQHAYLTQEGAAERWYGIAPGGDAAAAAAATALAAAAKAAAAAGAAAEESVKARRAATVVQLPAPTSFAMPLLPPLPDDTSYSFTVGADDRHGVPGTSASASTTASSGEYGNNGEYGSGSSGGSRGGWGQQRVPLWRSASGHFLVRPEVNCQEGGGYFVLDTGASGFVITPEAAARLGGQAFGEVHAASISGKVSARFIRLSSWALGGLSIQRPVLMVMELEGLVRGAPGEVVGIVGHDLFRRAVVELPQLIGKPQGRGGGGGNSGAAAQDSSSGSGSRSGSGSGSDWDSASDDETSAAVAGGWTPPAPVAVPRSTSPAGSGGAVGRLGSPASPPQSTPAFLDPTGSSAVHRASASAAVAAAATAAPTASTAPSSACNKGDAAATTTNAAVSASASSSTSPSAPSKNLQTSASRGEASAPREAAAGVTTRAPTPRRALLSHGNMGVRTAGDVCSNGSTYISNSSSISGGSSSSSASSSSSGSSFLAGSNSGMMNLSSTDDRGSSSSSGDGLSDRTSPSAPSNAGSTSSSSSRSSNSSSSGGGGGKPAGGSRRSAGRSQTARAMRRTARTVPYTLHDIVLHHPLEYDNDSEWVWHPLIMIANLPHIRLSFAAPDGAVRSSLLMVDSGACGADIMLHARAQRELGLLGTAAGRANGGSGGGGGSGSEGGRTQGHYLRGVGQDPKDFVQLQVLDLPWLEMAGVRFEQVRCMCAAVGGLDISVYSHGILCGDLLARVDWAIDYTHKRIGFRPGASGPRPGPR